MACVLKREAALRDFTAQWVQYAENASIDVADRFLDAAERGPSISWQHNRKAALRVSSAELSSKACAVCR